MTLQTNIWFVNTSTVAVFVAAALRGAVIPYKAKVTLANSGGCACPIHTALCTNWLTLTRNTAQKEAKSGDFSEPVQSLYNKLQTILLYYLLSM